MITLKDSTGATYNLPDNFTIKGTPFKKRTRSIQIAYADGGRQVGDAMLDIRTIQVEGIIAGDTESTYLTNKNALFIWITKSGLKLYSNAAADRYINVDEIANVNLAFVEGGFNRVAKISFDCLCEDPYYYYDADETDTEVIAATPTTYIVNNPSDFVVFPVIQITNAADNASLQLKNLTDGRNLAYVDGGFLNGDNLVIDCAAGTVFKGEDNYIGNFSGNFLRLLPGDNTLEYTGANCSILITWNKKEL